MKEQRLKNKDFLKMQAEVFMKLFRKNKEKGKRITWGSWKRWKRWRPKKKMMMLSLVAMLKKVLKNGLRMVKVCTQWSDISLPSKIADVLCALALN